MTRPPPDYWIHRSRGGRRSGATRCAARARRTSPPLTILVVDPGPYRAEAGDEKPRFETIPPEAYQLTPWSGLP